ncbi:MAG: Septum formation initiator [Verrucomicrobiota bacterium]|jgi:cell division protein FtsB
MKEESVDLGIWDKLTRAVLLLLVVAVAGGIVFLCIPLIQQNERMRQRNLELETQIQREEDNARALKATLDAQRSDPKAVERLAREKLGYAKPGEVVIRFQEPAAPAPSKP